MTSVDGRVPAAGPDDDEQRPTDRRSSFTEGAAFGVLSFAAMVVVGLATAVVTARGYGIHVLGELALATAPTGAVWFLSTVREQPALVRELVTLPHRSPRITGLWSAVFAFSFSLTLIVSLLVLGVTVILFHGPIPHPELIGPAAANLGGYLLITNTCWNLDTILTSFRDGRQLFWIRLHQAILYLVLAIGGAIAFGTVSALIAATIASWASALVHRLLVIRRWMPVPVPRSEIRAGFRALPEMLRFGLRVTPGAIAEGASNETGTWTLGLVGTIAEVGAYSRAWTLSRRFVELNWRIAEMLFPTLVESYGRNDKHRFDGVLVDTLRYVAVGMLLGAAVGGGAARDVMAVFGPGFTRASGALGLLLAVPALATLSTSSNCAHMARGRPWLTTQILTVRLVATLVAVPLLTLELGITGTALGLLVAYAVDNAIQLRLIGGYVSTPMARLWRPREVVGLAVACAVGFGSSRGMAALIPGAAGALPALIVGTAFYVGAYLLVAGLAPQDRKRLQRLRVWVRKTVPDRWLPQPAAVDQEVR